VALAPSAEWLARVEAALPALPARRRSTLAAAAGVEASDAALVTVVQLDLDELVTAAVTAGADPRLALNRAANEVAAARVEATSVDPAAFAALLGMEAGGTLSATQAKQVLAQMLTEGGNPAEIALARGFEAMAAGALSEVVDGIVAAHADEWERLKAGDQKLMGFFVGKVMAATAGQADGKAASSLLRERLGR